MKLHNKSHQNLIKKDNLNDIVNIELVDEESHQKNSKKPNYFINDLNEDQNFKSVIFQENNVEKIVNVLQKTKTMDEKKEKNPLILKSDNMTSLFDFTQNS